MPWPPPCRSPALPDQHRPAHMRDDETHAPARLGIDEALLLAPKNSEQRKARRRFVDGGRKLLHITVRLYPLLVETRFHEFGVWHAIFDAVDLPDIEHKTGGPSGDRPSHIGRSNLVLSCRASRSSRETVCQFCARRPSHRAMPPSRRRMPPTFATPRTTGTGRAPWHR